MRRLFKSVHLEVSPAVNWFGGYLYVGNGKAMYKRRQTRRTFYRTMRGQSATIKRIALMNCPSCQSQRIHHSRRRGLLEKVIFAIALVRPFRCEKCDLRFFRWSFAANRDAPYRDATLPAKILR